MTSQVCAAKKRSDVCIEACNISSMYVSQHSPGPAAFTLQLVNPRLKRAVVRENNFRRAFCHGVRRVAQLGSLTSEEVAHLWSEFLVSVFQEL
jgi:hypothetical protein